MHVKAMAVLVCAVAAAPPAVAAAQDPSMGSRQDSTRETATHDSLRPARGSGLRGRTSGDRMGSMGRLGPATGDSTRQPVAGDITVSERRHRGRGGAGRRRADVAMGLTGEQIVQLQTALTTSGCDAGAADGTIGPKTRRAIACARRKNTIAADDPNDLFRALGLDFTVGDTTAMGTSGTDPARMTGRRPNRPRPGDGVDRGAGRGAGRGRDSASALRDSSDTSPQPVRSPGMGRTADTLGSGQMGRIGDTTTYQRSLGPGDTATRRPPR